jgi:hypothetical protein
MDKVVTPPSFSDVGFPAAQQSTGSPSRRRMIKVILAAGMLITSTSSVFAQAYPNKPIRWIVPFPAGGPADAVARVIGRKLSVFVNVVVASPQAACFRCMA